MADEQRSRQGFLVLADISGYTAFLTGTELEHAQAIIHELTTLIRERLAPPLRFVKLEGDAVFCYADETAFPDGERLAELLEACYFEFSNLLLNMVRTTTCQCAACATMSTLDLKFIAHFGTYVVQASGGVDDLAGPDVILAHRLLKNGISEALGVQAYVYFTDACLQRMPAAFELPRHAEIYESFGETGGGMHDLVPVLQEMRNARRVFIGAGEGDLEASFDVPYPPAVVWRYIVDPVERLRWACVIFDEKADVQTANARGRLGSGASSHCNHGATTGRREYVDWRPFSYYTCRLTASPRLGLVPTRAGLETVELVPLDGGGTRVEIRQRVEHSGILWMLWLGATRLLGRGAIGRGTETLRSIMDEDAAALEEETVADATPPRTKDVIA